MNIAATRDVFDFANARAIENANVVDQSPAQALLANRDSALNGMMSAAAGKSVEQSEAQPRKSDVPALKPPATEKKSASGGAGALTEMLTRLVDQLGTSSLAAIDARLAAWQAKNDVRSNAGEKLSAEYEAAKQGVSDAIAAYEDALKALADAIAQAKAAQDRVDKLRGERDALTPGTLAYDAAMQKHETAMQSAAQAENAVAARRAEAERAQTAAAAAVNAADKLLNDGLNTLGTPPSREDAEDNLGNIGAMTKLMAAFIEMLGNSAETSLQNDMEIFEAMRKTRQTELERRNEEYKAEVRKAEELSKAMGWLGKIFGAILTVASVVGAVFAGGASVPLAVMGAAMMAGDTVISAATGFSLIGEALKPLMNSVIQPLTDWIGKGLGQLLEKLGVPKQTAELVGGVVGAVVAAVAVVAVMAVVMVVGSSVASKLGGAIGKFLGDALRKIVPDLIRDVAKTGGKVISKAAGNLMAGLGIHGDAAGRQLIGNTLNKIAAGGELANMGAQGGGAIAAGIYENTAADVQAEVVMDREILDKIDNWVKDAASKFAKTNGTIASLVEALSSSLTQQANTSKFMLNHARA
ncbi:Cell invasion protein SipB [Pandoraea terrae]|uniref:Translocator protein BipB n=1 Tax=Pandoraea terrae TaxID=1537710 RepID=A0A5E4TBS3_9BURK|nr:type III secretion system translocon subunit SctE [Pandoraea terrae]VVD84393.1 Cell invasion protein SipB [Pandoraea terrae]